MKTLMRLGYMLALLTLAAPAMASGTDSATVTSDLAKSCTFTSTPPAVVSIAPTPGETNIGRLGYTCNFVGATHLVLQLPDGTNLRNGANTVLYDVFWGIPPNPVTPGPYQHWFFPSNIAFDWITANAPNVEIGGDYFIKLNTAPTIAGTYTGVISYTLAP
ncbi:MAG: hypothetical protein K8S25_13795 [Alphaproteobacteria bacterium]|nr:hypothetical protein [Alphaproteobacteria bacterium]